MQKQNNKHSKSIVYHLEGFIQQQMFIYGGIPIWVCNCPEYKMPQPCTPHSCKHVDKIIVMREQHGQINQDNQS